MNHLSRHGRIKYQILKSYYSTMVRGQFSNENVRSAMTPTKNPNFGGFTNANGWRSVVPFKDPFNKPERFNPAGTDVVAYRLQIGDNVARQRKDQYLLNILPHIENSKEAVYGVLDAWVAWEQNFPTVSLKIILVKLARDHQWHRVIQVIKWMLSKGQCATMGTYSMLMKAFDMDHRPEEAHEFWMMKMGSNLRNVPWSCCMTIMSVYYQHNMLGRLVKLFKQLEAFNRKPPDRKVVQRVVNCYEMLGLLEERKEVLHRYSYVFSDSFRGRLKKRRMELRTPVEDRKRAYGWTCP